MHQGTLHLTVGLLLEMLEACDACKELVRDCFAEAPSWQRHLIFDKS